MNILLPVIIVLAVGTGFLAFLLIKSLLLPTQMTAIAQLLKNGRTQAATKAVKLLIAKNPRNAGAHWMLGQIYEAEGKGELALMEYKAVNQISQFGRDLPEAAFRARIAALFIHFGQSEEALKEYLLLVKLEPEKAENWYMAGKLFEERGRSDSAIGHYRKAIESDPRHSDAHFALGLLLYRDKKPLEAKNELSAAIRFDPGNTGAFFYLGKLQRENHDFSGALLAFEKALRDPEYKIKALVERGGCYMSMNDLDHAVPELERAVRASKDEASNETLYARYFLAMCYEKRRDIELAIDQWEKIYSRKPGFRDVAEKLSQYQEFRSDDKMKDYITSGREDFLAICDSVISSALGMQAREFTEIQDGVDIIATEAESGKWLGAKKLPYVFRFSRSPEILDDSVIRGILEQMKPLGVVKAAILTSSGFTRTAVEYAENRPVVLYPKERLQELLNRADFFTRKRR